MGIVFFVPSSPVARTSRIALHPGGYNGTHAQFSMRFYDASRVVHIGCRAHQGDLVWRPVVLRAYVVMIAGLAELFEQGKARVVPFALATLVIDQVANVVAQPSITSRCTQHLMRRLQASNQKAPLARQVVTLVPIKNVHSYIGVGHDTSQLSSNPLFAAACWPSQ